MDALAQTVTTIFTTVILDTQLTSSSPTVSLRIDERNEAERRGRESFAIPLFA
jgi:hypothetical protein